VALTKTSQTYWARIYIAGPIDIAKQIIRRECMVEGLCVTITPTDYIYTGGEESGYIVELVNYPRFPKTSEQIFNRAVELALALRDDTYQHSVMVMTPNDTYWYTTREENK
jgi:hypothetical protein